MEVDLSYNLSYKKGPIDSNQISVRQQQLRNALLVALTKASENIPSGLEN